MPIKVDQTEELPSVNLTPMIDVVFLLIIFFMVGTQFTNTEQSIDINLPSAGRVNPMIGQPARREVVVRYDGVTFLDGQAVNHAQLTERLSAMLRNYPDLAVAVRADAEAKQGAVVPVYGAIQRAGVTNMAVLSSQEPMRR